MPVRNEDIIRIGPGKFKVVSPSGSVHSKGTSLKNAKSQQRLLNAVDHGWKPTHKRKEKKERLPRSATKGGKTKFFH
jgi:hypothetical protein